jgi:hypothetical protein
MKAHPALFLLAIFWGSGLSALLCAIGALITLFLAVLMSRADLSYTEQEMLLFFVSTLSYLIGGVVGAGAVFMAGTVSSSLERAHIKTFIGFTLLSSIVVGSALLPFDVGRTYLIHFMLNPLDVAPPFPLFFGLLALVPTISAVIALGRAQRQAR